MTNRIPISLIISQVLLLTACEPRVKVEAPEKPIEINLNLKIDHEVRIKLDKEIDQLITKNPELF